MTRRFYFSEQTAGQMLDILVVFDGCFFWKGTFHTSEVAAPVLAKYETGRTTEHPDTASGYREVSETDFWNEAGSASSFIRWALSAYDVHLSRMSMTPVTDKR